MISFSQLEASAPELAAHLRERHTTTGLAILGTVRADGSPRVSPIEVTFHDGHLYIGMMPGSRKAVDVGRDPRVSMLTPVADKDDLSGEGKLFGVLRPVDDPDQIAAVFGAAVDGSDYDVEDLAGSPVFELLVSGAAWQHVEGDTFVTESWDPVHGVRHRRRAGATGEVEEIDAQSGVPHPSSASA
jgi:hypothetical protein